MPRDGFAASHTRHCTAGEMSTNPAPFRNEGGTMITSRGLDRRPRRRLTCAFLINFVCLSLLLNQTQVRRLDTSTYMATTT
jgi:hypothetical protein